MGVAMVRATAHALRNDLVAFSCLAKLRLRGETRRITPFAPYQKQLHPGGG